MTCFDSSHVPEGAGVHLWEIVRFLELLQVDFAVGGCHGELFLSMVFSVMSSFLMQATRATFFSFPWERSFW